LSGFLRILQLLLRLFDGGEALLELFFLGVVIVGALGVVGVLLEFMHPGLERAHLLTQQADLRFR
jgi:hypothetical protein